MIIQNLLKLEFAQASSVLIIRVKLMIIWFIAYLPGDLGGTLVKARKLLAIHKHALCWKGF